MPWSETSTAKRTRLSRDRLVAAAVDRGFALEQAAAMATFFRHFLLGMVTEEARQQVEDATVTTEALGSDLTRRDGASPEPPVLTPAAHVPATIAVAAIAAIALPG